MKSKKRVIKKLNPARSVIEKFARYDTLGNRKKMIESGAQVLARKLRLNVSSVYRWQYPTDKSGGLGGVIPQEHFHPLLDLAKQSNIELTADDLIGTKPKEKAL